MTATLRHKLGVGASFAASNPQHSKRLPKPFHFEPSRAGEKSQNLYREKYKKMKVSLFQLHNQDGIDMILFGFWDIEQQPEFGFFESDFLSVFEVTG